MPPSFAFGSTPFCVTKHTVTHPLQLRTAGPLPVKVPLVACRMIMAALQDPLNQFFIQLSGGVERRACLSAGHGAAYPAVLLGVCTLLGRAVGQLALLGVCTLLGRAIGQLACPHSIRQLHCNCNAVRTLPAWPAAFATFCASQLPGSDFTLHHRSISLAFNVPAS